MNINRTNAIQYTKTHFNDFLDQLSELVRIPSVSTSPDHKADLQNTAQKVAQLFSLSGLDDIQIIPTAGHPVVFGQLLEAGPQKPTVLVYGHYDVQPADPIELWETGPFDPSVRGDYLFGRGASDMKGQVIAALAALQSIKNSGGSLPVNVKFIVEGEEEIGSPHLKSLIESRIEQLACDVSLNPDAGMIAEDLPTMVYALRGLVLFELRIYGPDHDLHSGVFGGVIHNPAQAMCELIAGLHDSNGTITIQGFYDQVRSLGQQERGELARLPMDEQFYLAQTGAPQVWGEKEYTPVERTGARPTLEINGLYSGFISEGTKTVLPAYAMAKISSRLVADQDPEKIHQLLRAHLEKHVPPTVRWELDYFGGSRASATDPNHPAAIAMRSALEQVWDVRPVLKREGGSVPVVADIQKILSADTVLTGFGLPDDRIHSPNEHLHLPTWHRGIEALVHFFYNYGQEEE